MPKITLITLLVLLTISKVSCAGIFELKINEFINEYGRKEDGDCCSIKDKDSSECLNQCRTFFRVCATHTSLSGVSSTAESPIKNIDDNKTENDINSMKAEKNARFNIDFPCTIGMTVTQVVAENNFVQDEDSPILFYYRFPFPWPGDVSIIIEAWHHTDRKHDLIKETSKVGQMISRFAINEITIPEKDATKWKNVELDKDNRTISFDFRVQCDSDYYGINCSDYCSASDNPRKFICSNNGSIVCRKGWTGEQCETPICRNGCNERHGYCRRPGECRCRIGWSGETCNRCVLLPGCYHGTCDSPFECNCKKGWDGLFCNHPICKEGCSSTRGYCDKPDECRCRIGWGGDNCNNCTTIPGCKHGSCDKPLECKCEPGWSGIFCNNPICKEGCHEIRGFCQKPDTCRCKVGWQGDLCDKCHPYPGCKNGFCNSPWECQCKHGWGGFLCDEKLDYCERNNPCKNKANCISKSKEDGNYLCICLGKYTGRNCDILASE